MLSKELLDDPPLGELALARWGRERESIWVTQLAYMAKTAAFIP